MEDGQRKEGTMSDEHLEGDLGREEVDAHKEPERTDEPGDGLKNEPEAGTSGTADPTEEIHMPLSWSVPLAAEAAGTAEPVKVDQNAETKKWPLEPAPEREVPLVEVPSGELPSDESPEKLEPEAVEPAPAPKAPKPPKKKKARRKKPAQKRTDKARRKPAKRKGRKSPAKRPAKKRKKAKKAHV
jgi:hypothetical protein